MTRSSHNGGRQQCLTVCALFEAELLLALMLEKWRHPYADDESFRREILEAATELLQVASEESCSEVFMEGLSAQDMNFVSVIWYVEWNSIQGTTADRRQREIWLRTIRQTLPSCFCQPNELGP